MRWLSRDPAHFKIQSDLLLQWGLTWGMRTVYGPCTKGIHLITCEICLPRRVTRDVRKDELIFTIRWLIILSFHSQTWKYLPCRPFQWVHFWAHTSSPCSVMVWHCLESDLGCLANEQWANGDSLKEHLILFQSLDLFVFKSTAPRLNWLVLLTFPGTIVLLKLVHCLHQTHCNCSWASTFFLFCFGFVYMYII